MAKAFFIALTRLREGDQSEGREALHRIVEAEAAIEGDHDLIANAQIILGLLEFDNRRVERGVRTLTHRHGPQWPSWSAVEAQTLNELVAEESARDLGNAEIVTARVDLGQAAWAALYGQQRQVDTLLDRIRQTLGRADGVRATELRDTAARIEALSARIEPNDTRRPMADLGLAALRVDGVTHPWTEKALRLWAAHGNVYDDPIALHHRAVAEHARAYHLELEHDTSSLERWARALRYWARLHREPYFWDQMRKHLETVMTTIGSEELRSTVEDVRAKLPDRLLETHVGRIRAVWREHPELARGHVQLIRRSEFPDAAKNRAVDAVVGDADRHIRSLISAGEHRAALASARKWMEIDPRNARIVEIALDLGIARGTGWNFDSQSAAECRTMLEDVVELVGASRPVPFSKTDLTAGPQKLARTEFWLGSCYYVLALDTKPCDTAYGRCLYDRWCAIDRWRAGARGHLTEALRLGLPAFAPYNSAAKFLAWAEKGEHERLCRRSSGYRYL